MELLPAGPKWVSQEIDVPGYSTKDLIVVYYRDPVECVQWILQNPVYSNRLQYSPEYRTTPDGNREYRDWIMSDSAWLMQVRSWCLLTSNILTSNQSRNSHLKPLSSESRSLLTRQCYRRCQAIVLPTHS